MGLEDLNFSSGIMLKEKTIATDSTKKKRK
jgi:hypothetical protein